MLLLWENSSWDFHVGDLLDSKGVGLWENRKSFWIMDQFFYFDFFLREIQDSDARDSGFRILIESLSKLSDWVVL